MQVGASGVSDNLFDVVVFGDKYATDNVKVSLDYLSASFPALNACERSAPDVFSVGIV